MKTISITSTEASRNLGDYLTRVKENGERFLVTNNDEPVAELSPAGGSKRATWGELKAAMIGHTFDEDFADDLERVNESDQLPSDPWE